MQISGRQERQTEALAPRCEEAAEVVPAGGGGICKQRQLWLVGRCFRYQIDEAGDGVAAVERRRRTFDDLHLPKIERRHLKERKAAGEAAVQGKTVLEYLRVAAVKALNPDRRASRHG